MTEAAILAALREIRDEVRGLRADLARRPQGRGAEREQHIEAIAAVVEGRLFSVAELLAHAAIPKGEALRIAIVGMVGALNGRRLGKFLRAIEGENIGRYRLERVGEQRDGISWVLRVCGNETRKPALTIA